MEWNGSHRMGLVLDCRKMQVNHVEWNGSLIMEWGLVDEIQVSYIESSPTYLSCDLEIASL